MAYTSGGSPPTSLPAPAFFTDDHSSIPLVGEAILKAHLAFVPNDTRFRAAMRLQQSLWRHEHGLQPGAFIDEAGKRHRVGSMLQREAGRDGANWLDPQLERLVRHELAYRERGAAIDVHRLRRNLLSSQPMCFNVLGPLKVDLALATRLTHQIAPGMFHEVQSIHFETSPGRGHPRFTADFTAFDAILRGTSPTGHRAALALEFKFTESMAEPAPERFSDRIFEIILRAELFRDVDLAPLWRTPFQQLTREVALAQSLLDADLADDVALFVVAPAQNHHVRQAVCGFFNYLTEPRPATARFGYVTLESFVDAFEGAGASSYADQLRGRYLDLRPVEALLFGSPPTHRPTEPLALPQPGS